MKIKGMQNIFDKTAFFLMMIYIGECALGNSGRWLQIGPLSIRIIIFSLCFIFSLPAVFRNLKSLFKNNQVIITIAFLVYLIFCAGIGYLTGNSLKFIISDATSFMSLALIPAFLSIINTESKIDKAINVFFICSLILSVVVVFLHFFLAFQSNETLTEINILINSRNSGGLATLQTGLQRIYFRSGIVIQVAMIYGVWKIIKLNKTEKGKLIFYYISESLLLFACILSYTRGFWLGLVASAILVLILSFKYWKTYLKIVASVLAGIIILFSASWACYGKPLAFVEIINRFDPNLIVLDGTNSNDNIDNIFSDDSDLSVTDQNNAASVLMRIKTLNMAKQKIASKPIFGNGLGENLDDIRNDGKIEYMYHDILMKTGIVGLLLFLMTFLGFIAHQIKQYLPLWVSSTQNESENIKTRNLIMISAYIGILVTSFFNPFLTNPIGIMVLSLTVCAVYQNKNCKFEV